MYLNIVYMLGLIRWPMHPAGSPERWASLMMLILGILAVSDMHYMTMLFLVQLHNWLKVVAHTWI